MSGFTTVHYIQINLEANVNQCFGKKKTPFESPGRFKSVLINIIKAIKHLTKEFILKYLADHRYEWTKDGEPLTITGLDIQKKAGVGTLIIENPREEHEGIYQCKATNEYGTAVAVKTHFKAASKGYI